MELTNTHKTACSQEVSSASKLSYCYQELRGIVTRKKKIYIYMSPDLTYSLDIGNANLEAYKEVTRSKQSG